MLPKEPITTLLILPVAQGRKRELQKSMQFAYTPSANPHSITSSGMGNHKDRATRRHTMRAKAPNIHRRCEHCGGHIGKGHGFR